MPPPEAPLVVDARALPHLLAELAQLRHGVARQHEVVPAAPRRDLRRERRRCAAWTARGSRRGGLPPTGARGRRRAAARRRGRVSCARSISPAVKRKAPARCAVSISGDADSGRAELRLPDFAPREDVGRRKLDGEDAPRPRERRLPRRAAPQKDEAAETLYLALDLTREEPAPPRRPREVRRGLRGRPPRRRATPRAAPRAAAKFARRRRPVRRPPSVL